MGYYWTWEEAFLKFRYGDGESPHFTEIVSETLSAEGYESEYEPWGIHNDIITSLKDKTGKVILPSAEIHLGYDNAREYLPKEIIEFLDNCFEHE